MAAADSAPPGVCRRQARRVPGACDTQRGQETAITESFLVKAWQRLPGGASLATSGGKMIRILHPGRKNTDSGPDFRDALIAMGRRRLRGDIEVDVRARHWRSHGHHRNPGFNNVILHVVMWDEGRETSLVRSGEGIPILALAPHLQASLVAPGGLLSLAPAPEEPCRRVVRQGGKPRVLAAIDRAGARRFRARAARFRDVLARNDPEQVLYEALLAALGYAKNRESFEQLARLLPLRSVYGFASRGSAAEIQALMLAASGLAPSHSRPAAARTGPRRRDKARGVRVERPRRLAGIRKTMSRSDWRLFRVRPENHPVRRIAAASHVLARNRGELLTTVLACVRQPSAGEARRELERTFTVGARCHPASLSPPGVRRKAPSLVGRDRARDVAVNVILPFCLAWAEARDDRWLRKRVRELYVNCPGLQENWITRHMEGQIFGAVPAMRRRACYQQGLIQLHRAFCAEHRCRACPLARRNAPGHGQPAGAGDLPDAEAAEQPE
ncbi:MAG: DUF2851 family protein [Chloroflexi bacterium]|nr:DUF2851 family protein [Chloroflexota bacterium]